ncbi:MAG: hypothetical protein LBD30_00695 [Verrucomicrobiales bacterium]|jgi:hypothetical protein|nr:hypothetical protein [Verrucomicrobiales bacterium]
MKPAKPNYKLTLNLTEDQYTELAQARQLCHLSEESLARLALSALCRYVERHIGLVAPIEVLSRNEWNAFRQTSIAPACGNAHISTGTEFINDTILVA